MCQSKHIPVELAIKHVKSDSYGVQRAAGSSYYITSERKMLFFFPSWNQHFPVVVALISNLLVKQNEIGVYKKHKLPQAHTACPQTTGSCRLYVGEAAGWCPHTISGLWLPVKLRQVFSPMNLCSVCVLFSLLMLVTFQGSLCHSWPWSSMMSTIL